MLLLSLSHFSPKPSLAHSSLRLLRQSQSPHLLKLPLYSSSVACLVSRLSGSSSSFSSRSRVHMESSSLPATASVDSVTHDLKNQSLDSGRDGDSNKFRLKLEDLNWDHSFVRELPGDPRTDIIPREVSFILYYLNLRF